jgi:diguanylate cyclase (GGDEF)-like protein
LTHSATLSYNVASVSMVSIIGTLRIPATITLFSILLFLILLILLIKRHINLIRLLGVKQENLEEEINTLRDQIKGQRETHSSLEQKTTYYNNLRDIADKIQNLVLNEICQHLTDSTFYLLGRNRGCCLLYLVEAEKQNLYLFLSKKEDNSLVIKQKQGDIFDRWVVRHTGSLLVEDARDDFRFDLDKTRYKPERPILSLISAPLKVEQRFLGVLRLDSGLAYRYSQDALRFLDTVCSLGALGLENSLLFQQIQELAIRDSLTSVYTKGYYLERLDEEIQRAVRQPHAALSLLMIDIDNFKNYNDQYGHIAGDIVLRGLSKLFLNFFAQVPNAMVCRFGGEEFSVFLPFVTKKESQSLAEDLRSKVQEQRFILRRKETQVTISIGVAYLSLKMKAAKELILQADRALYQAKERGRNQVCIS